MTDKLKEISKWILMQGQEIAQEALDEKLKEAYDQGWMDAHCADVDKVVADLYINTMRVVNREKTKLYERGFNATVPTEDVAEMMAYKFIEENLPKIMKDYSES